MKHSGWNVVEQLKIFLAPVKAAMAFFCFMLSDERELWRRGQRQTVQVKEEKFVCSSFPLSTLTTLISLSLSVTVCLPLSLFIMTFSLFLFQRFPGGDSVSWLSLNYLSAANSHSLCPVHLYFVFGIFSLSASFINNVIVDSNLSWII